MMAAPHAAKTRSLSTAGAMSPFAFAAMARAERVHILLAALGMERGATREAPFKDTLKRGDGHNFVNFVLFSYCCHSLLGFAPLAFCCLLRI